MKKAVKEVCEFRKSYELSCRDCLYYRTEQCDFTYKNKDSKPQYKNDKNRKEEKTNGNYKI